jgi:hypothetical protein
MYDFINNGDFPNDERAPYRLIRWWLLDCYYTYCRHKLHARNFENDDGWAIDEHELGYAYEQCMDSYGLPIEQLMLEVLTMILNAGREPMTVESYHRAKINAILENHDLQEMLNTLSGEERSEFERDLRLLNLM